MNRTALCLVVALATGTVGATPSLAQSSNATANDADARTAFDAAVRAFDDGDYEAALVFFRRAYDLSGRAQLLYNMGQCADRLRRDDEAIEAFERYLDAAPDAENAGTVRARLAHLHAAQRRQDVPTPAEVAEANEPAPQRQPVVESPAEEEPGGLSSGAVWGIVLGSVAAVGAAVLIGVLAAGGNDDPDVVIQGLR